MCEEVTSSEMVVDEEFAKEVKATSFAEMYNIELLVKILGALDP